MTSDARISAPAVSPATDERADGQRTAVAVGAPTLSRTVDGRWHVGADVDGNEAFLVADAPLVANGDAWASAMLMTAAKAGGALRIDADLDSRLLRNLGGVQAFARIHWNFPGARIAPRSLVTRAPAGAPAMFFTCGVDSFYTLLRRRESVRQLVFVRGLNINLGLGESALFPRVRAAIEEVSREVGVPAVFLETNLRSHPTFSRVGWDVTHVGALAAAAHALSPVVSKMYVASSEQAPPWGSQPELDPLWSSNAVELINDGSERRKLDKVRAIANWPLVHRHLRVCYAARDGTLNCGRCGKCVGTQIRFEVAGARHLLQTFPQHPLVELVDALRFMVPSDVPFWTHLTEQVDNAELRAAMRRRLARRPTMVDKLRTKAVWLRRNPLGRRLRGLAKRVLIG